MIRGFGLVTLAFNGLETETNVDRNHMPRRVSTVT